MPPVTTTRGEALVTLRRSVPDELGGPPARPPQRQHAQADDRYRAAATDRAPLLPPSIARPLPPAPPPGAAEVWHRAVLGSGTPVRSPAMEHVRFGRTGLRVSRLCLGTMTFGFQCDEPASVAILDAAAEAGITFLDTADAYPLGAPLADARPHRGDPRPVAQGPPRPVRPGDQVLRPDRTVTVGRRQLPPEHHARHRRVAPPPADRPRRPVPAALLGREHAHRRDAPRPRRPRPRRARCATSASRTCSPTSWPAPSAAARSSASPASTRCSRATTCSSGSSSGSCCRSRPRSRSPSSRTTRWPAGC